MINNKTILPIRGEKYSESVVFLHFRVSLNCALFYLYTVE